MPVPEVDRGHELTKGYIDALAQLRSGSEVADKPVLCVYAKETKQHVVRTPGHEDARPVMMTEFRLIDGDGEQIHARLSVGIAQWGRMLNRGDMIRLDNFTELRYRPNEASSRMPALFVLGLSRVGYFPLQDDFVKKEMLACKLSLPSEHNDVIEPAIDDLDPRKDPPPACTHNNRLCAAYGVRFLSCICDVIPPENLNLATVKEDCYFATDDLEGENAMSRSHKRNMLFWWYATNVYSIVGAGNVQRLPPCLNYAIRKAYLPERDDMKLTGFHRRNSR